jgi:hypothetical protein
MFVFGTGKNTGHEAAMPADGAVVAADCRERRYRHIPLLRQLTNEPVEPLDITSYQESNAPKSSRPLISVVPKTIATRSGQAIGHAPDNEIYALVMFRGFMI